MMFLSHRLSLLILSVSCAPFLLALPANPQTPPPPTSGEVGSRAHLQEPPGGGPATKTRQTGMDHPATLVSATSEDVLVKVQLRGLTAPPKDGDLEAGLLTNLQQPNLQVRPEVKLVDYEPKDGKSGDFLVLLNISRVVPFGETTISLLNKGRQVDTLRFSKPGLIAKPAGEGGFIARESKGPLLLVLENPSLFPYERVRARLRFENQDVCLFKAEQLSKNSTSQPDSKTECGNFSTWTAFDIPQYAQVTLRASPAAAWFVDPATSFARAGKQKGWLTLRFQASEGAAIYEQNLPLEIHFQPSESSLLLSLVCVAIPILIGALLSVFLRISLPNLRRRRQLKNQLNEAAKLTASISAEVDSNLRVLLRVERLEWDEIRRSGWWFGPNDGEFTLRVEQALPALRRRIDAVRRLDAALVRRSLLAEQGLAPTRLEQIAILLDGVTETLKQAQLTDEDWVSVNQRIEAAQKLLREPTQTEKEAFEAMLAGRWGAIRDHFGGKADGLLKIPPSLATMNDCFPDPALLPDPNDKDGSLWVKSVGAVRADLQLTALGLLWDFQFLAPATVAEPWSDAKKRLTGLLATPATDNLRTAKLFLRQLAEGVSEEEITAALQAGSATIVVDPPIPRANEKIRYAVRFLKDSLNTAAARELVSCRWSFKDQHGPKDRWYTRNTPPSGDLPPTDSIEPTVPFVENGWFVYHYFESGVTESEISVSFHSSEGKPVDVGLKAAKDTPSHWARITKQLKQSTRKGQWAPFGLELVQLGATLLVPLATLASTTANGGTDAHWWQLVGIGFGADTIKNLIVSRPDPSPPTPGGSA